jgi:endoplasmic reticulum-Golgi intermediate compartment protein 1
MMIIKKKKGYLKNYPLFFLNLLIKQKVIGLDIQDDMGRHEVGFIDNVKTSINDNKGCRMKSNFKINKVPGNFHVSTHSSPQQPIDASMT